MTELLEAAFPADPVLDIAVSHALLVAVAAGGRPPALRVHHPGPTAAFGRLDALLPGFDEACAVARARGFTPVLRSAGGHAAVYDERSVVIDHVTYERDATARLQPRFEDQAERVRGALAALGADARIGELAGEYCPGPHSVNVAGRVKLAGIAQRVVRHGAATSAVVVAGGGPELRAAIADIYGALGLPVEPDVAGALDEHVAGVTAADVAAALRAAYGNAALAPGELGPELLAAAQGLVARHRVPVRSAT